MDLLKQLYSINSYSGYESVIRDFIIQKIKKMDGVYYDVDSLGNIIIIKGKAKTYPCFCAHLDEVHRPQKKVILQLKNRIFGYSYDTGETVGIGADDKNGIWLCLKILEKYDTVKIVFFVGEEIGCIGSSHFDLTFFSDVRFIIEPDRRGDSDLIAVSSGVQLCSKKFLKAINFQNFGYKKAQGTVTDVLELVENGVGVSCINISAGYFNAHRDSEYTVISALLKTQNYLNWIIENVTDVYPYEGGYYYRKNDLWYSDSEYDKDYNDWLKGKYERF